MWYIINALLLRELKTRFGQNPKLGYIWVVLEPSILICLIAYLYVYVIERSISQMPFIFVLIAGIVPYFMFRKIIINMMNGIDSNRTLFTYRPVKPIHVLISRAILEAILHFILLFVLMFLSSKLFQHYWIPYNILEVLFIFVWFAIFSFSIGLIFTALFYNNDAVKNVITYTLIMFYIGSAVVVPLWFIPEKYINYLAYNPILQILELLKQNYFIEYPKIRQINYTYPIVCTTLTLFFGLYLYNKNKIKLSTVSE
ncbi:ABC transporter permease [Campylobacter sp. RM12654]|uniref:ABC transporter permease n=1 Tax=Campylobacter sp. RM12654 TaxID=2735738 RepID=UPI003014E7E3|nr:ABC transporter permease [Campylobacter sp. RM12654]